MPTERQKLLTYRRLEKELIGFFRFFNDLCKACFDYSVETIRNDEKIDRDEMCCCLLDNQVQDHWQYLDRAQRLMNGTNWNKSGGAGSGHAGKLAEKNSDWLQTGRRRLPGNGPCPALGCHGCVLNSYRVPTCSTQLCPKMLRILNDLGIVKGPTAAPRQIEEFGNLKSPLNYLFGLDKKAVDQKTIEQFSQLIKNLEKKCLEVPKEKWRAAVEKEKKTMNY